MSGTEVFDLTGKVAVVTGSTKGIAGPRRRACGGRRAGGRLQPQQELCDEVATEIAAATGREVAGIACHVGDWDTVPAFVDAVMARFGRIDVLVNNAGINPARISPHDMTLEYWRKVFSVNLEGPLRTSQLVAPIMRDQGGGSIVNIGTMAAYSGGGNICAYGASKAALLNLTKSMAWEWAAWKVRVNALSPGPFMSEMMAGGAATQEGFLDLVAGGTFQKRVADPAEIVGPIVYLASDASSFVTGDDISVSGGMHK
ncbi:MAG: SDR family oxidoreductase [Acidimicrobiales bacterium]